MSSGGRPPRIASGAPWRDDTIPTALAIAGCGIGRTHIAQGYARHPDKFRVVGLCDVDAGRLAAVGDEFGIARRTPAFDELLRIDDVDIVDICTPPHPHVAQVLAALSADKEVVCEKPVAGSLAEIDRVIAAERGLPRRVLPVFQYRFGNGMQKAKRIIHSGIAGKPYLATVETAWKRTPEYYATPWRGRWRTELGGVLLSHATHAHDLMTCLLGPPASVFARIATRVNPIDTEDCAVASLVMRSGALVSLAATLGSQHEVTRLRLCFEHVTFESGGTPYAPGDDPWAIIPASVESETAIAEILAGYRRPRPGSRDCSAPIMRRWRPDRRCRSPSPTLALRPNSPPPSIIRLRPAPP
jgi:predicted dehydrogenase